MMCLKQFHIRSLLRSYAIHRSVQAISGTVSKQPSISGRHPPAHKLLSPHSAVFLSWLRTYAANITAQSASDQFPVTSTPLTHTSPGGKKKKMISLVTCDGPVHLEVVESYKMIRKMDKDQLLTFVDKSHDLLDKTHAALCLKRISSLYRMEMRQKSASEKREWINALTSNLRFQVLCAVVAKKAVHYEVDISMDMARFMIDLGLDSTHPALQVCLEVVKHHIGNLKLDQLAHLLQRLNRLSLTPQTQVMIDAIRLTVIHNWDVFFDRHPSITAVELFELKQSFLAARNQITATGTKDKVEMEINENLLSDDQLSCSEVSQVTYEMWRSKARNFSNLEPTLLLSLSEYLPSENIKPTQVFLSRLMWEIQKSVSEKDQSGIFALRLIKAIAKHNISSPRSLEEWCIEKLTRRLRYFSLTSHKDIVQCVKLLGWYCPAMLQEIGAITCEKPSITDKMEILDEFYQYGYQNVQLLQSLTQAICEDGCSELDCTDKQKLCLIFADSRQVVNEDIMTEIIHGLFDDISDINEDPHMFVKLCASCCVLKWELPQSAKDSLRNICLNNESSHITGWFSTARLLQFVSRCLDLPPSISSNGTDLRDPLPEDVVSEISKVFVDNQIRYHCTTKSGIYVDCIIEPTEHSESPGSTYKVAVLELTQDCFHVNTGQLRGLPYFYAQQLQADGYTVIIMKMEILRAQKTDNRRQYITEKVKYATQQQNLFMLPADIAWH